ncbi:uncharacterized protein [Acropora muricata]|uniref:uncharacterized protein n=1 Tax=Acropora muricata TaxID=159855 RepID=UPI0034E531E9
MYIFLLNFALKATESANDIASRVRAAFQSQVVPTFQLPENIQSSGPSGNRARGRGRSRGRGSVNQVARYSFMVVLVNHDQRTIPRRNQRVELENSGRVKRFEISRGAPPATTFRKLCELFADVDGHRDVEVVRVVGSNTLEPFAAAASGCSARDLNSVRGQGSLYLRLKAASAALGTTNTSSSAQPHQTEPIVRVHAQNLSVRSSTRGRFWRQQLTENNLVDMSTSSDEEETPPDLAGLNDHHDHASGPSTITTPAQDANDVTNRAVLTRGDNAVDHSSFGGAEAVLSFGDQSNSGGSFGRHPNSNNGDTSSASAFISAENTEANNRTIADIGDNVSPIDGDDGTDITHSTNGPEGTSRVPIVTDGVDDDSNLFGGRHSATTQIDAGNDDDDVEITRVLNAVQDAGLFP